jgi:NAD(P)-dependent dehydrogenase (short-subunit alcohol dehydrogenase family)
VLELGLADAVCLVTGGGSGIGEAIARGLAECDATVVIADIDERAAKEVAAGIDSAGGEAIAEYVDVRDEPQIDAMVKCVEERFGRIDVLVNNVGGYVGRNESSVNLRTSDWSATMDLTLTSALAVSRAAAPAMLRQRRGSIVNIASIYGLVGHRSQLYDRTASGNHPEQLSYITAKAGLLGLTRGLACYWGRAGIRVNAVAPGMIKVDHNAQARSREHWIRLAEHTPLGRIGRPDDVVGGVIYLASTLSGFVTGHVLVVDGGWTAW